MKYNYLPPLSNIRSSLKHRSKEYILENSLHGVPYFADPTRPIWERGLWFILTIASIVVTILTIITIWHKFQEEPTITGLDTNANDIEILFPQVFVCLDGNQLNYSGLSELEKNFYEKLYDWKWGEAIDDEIEGTFFKGVKSYREIFSRLAPDCNVILHKKIPKTRNNTHFWDSDFINVITPTGVCCKYNIKIPFTLAQSPWLFQFVSIFPVRIYLMDQLDVGPSRDVYPLMKIEKPANIRLDVYQTYVTSELSMLSRYQRKCHYEKEQLTYNNCQLNCISNNILEKCKCLPWFLVRNGTKECSLLDYSCSSKAHKKDFNCDCVLPCNFTAFSPKWINNDPSQVLIEEKIIQIQLVWPKTRFRREIRLGYLDLVVSFGGIAGLFLGYSILTSVELFYYLSFRTYCGAVLDSSRKKNIIMIREKVSIPSKSDIKFIRYDVSE